jgi:hypothetical protein
MPHVRVRSTPLSRVAQVTRGSAQRLRCTALGAERTGQWKRVQIGTRRGTLGELWIPIARRGAHTGGEALSALRGLPYWTGPQPKVGSRYTGAPRQMPLSARLVGGGRCPNSYRFGESALGAPSRGAPNRAPEWGPRTAGSPGQWCRAQQYQAREVLRVKVNNHN